MAVFCDPTTVQFNNKIPPLNEHWVRYPVISPLGSSGGPQLSLTDVELMGDAENDVGGVLGPGKSIKLIVGFNQLMHK